jgi:hypothetical protein
MEIDVKPVGSPAKLNQNLFPKRSGSINFLTQSYLRTSKIRMVQIKTGLHTQPKSSSDGLNTRMKSRLHVREITVQNGISMPYLKWSPGRALKNRQCGLFSCKSIKYNLGHAIFHFCFQLLHAFAEPRLGRQAVLWEQLRFGLDYRSLNTALTTICNFKKRLWMLDLGH